MSIDSGFASDWVALVLTTITDSNSFATYHGTMPNIYSNTSTTPSTNSIPTRHTTYGGPPRSNNESLALDFPSVPLDTFTPSENQSQNFREIIKQNNLRSMAANGGKPLTYGDARVYYSDGTITSTRSAQGLAHNIESAKPNSIKAVVIRGHGGTNGTTLNGSPGPHSADSLDVAWKPAGPGLPAESKLVLTGRSTKGKPFRKDFKELLDGKLSGGRDSGIFINSCNCGDPSTNGPNLIETLSKEFPGVRIRGVKGTLNESKSRFFEKYFEKPAWGSLFVNLKDGKKISPGGRPYTEFPNES